MPELPDIELYIGAMRERIAGQTLRSIRMRSPFLVRSVEPPVEAVEGRTVCELRRLGKRIVIGFDGDLFAVVHLMIAGRLRWEKPRARLNRKIGLAAFDFDHGTLVMTEAGTKRRASLHIVIGEAALRQHDPGGIEPLTASREQFSAAIRRGNHTLKRVLTDPRVLAGIGNAYSDEILHAARLSPIQLTSRLSDEDAGRIFDAAGSVLRRWMTKLREEFDGRFPGPGDVTAFRPDFAVHGRFGLPCPACGSPVQRIRYADNETNYCARCQTGGNVLADRSLSRLLKQDWPRSIDEWEEE